MKKILVIYGAASAHVATTYHYTDAFCRHSRFEVHYLCLEHSPAEPVDLSRYDAVWVNYCARLIFSGYVPDVIKDSLAAFRGPKLVAVQDEYDDTNRLREELRRIGASVVLTCVPQEFLEYVYPRAMFPDVRFETVLTGYVSDELLGIDDIPPLADRPIVVGYRGRDLPGRYGELGRQKAQIGLRVREACLKRGIPCDIAVDEASRIYGSAWFEFIRSCRVMLGSESGSNVFDFDGSLSKLYRDMKAADPDLPYERFQPFIAEREREIDMGQISPRVFEAAAMRTAMVLFRGRYSGLLEPGRHFVPLEPDYSNLEDVLERIHDLPALEAMVERAYQDLIASGACSYRAFVHRMDDVLEQAMRDRAYPTPHRAMPVLDAGLVTRRPLGHDPYLLGKVQRLQEQIAYYEKLYVEQSAACSAAHEQIDRLISEVHMYSGAVNQVAEERNRACEERDRLREENGRLHRGLNDIGILARWAFHIRAFPRRAWQIGVRRLREALRAGPLARIVRVVRAAWRALDRHPGGRVVRRGIIRVITGAVCAAVNLAQWWREQRLQWRIRWRDGRADVLSLPGKCAHIAVPAFSMRMAGFVLRAGWQPILRKMRGFS